MKIMNIKNNTYNLIYRLIGLFLLFFLTVGPLPVWAKSANDYEIIRPQKFQIELYAGYAALNPSDLNLFVSSDIGIQAFSYDDYLDYLQTNSQIQSWAKNQNTERQKIQRAFPFGARLKYHLNQTIAISVGLRYLTSSYESDIELQYTRNEFFNEQYKEELMYSPYSLSVEAYVPALGIHIMKKLKKTLTLEGFLAGGPMFIRCQYLSDWTYEWWIQGANYNWLTFQSSGTLEEKGSGTGIALDVGGRLAYSLFKSLGIFLEGGYAYQVAKNISGGGKEVKDDSTETWDGRWSIKREKMTAPWGELELELPTNYWPEGTDEGKIRDFELDLSGFQLRLGLSYRF
jgi:hypothetical protein